MGNNNKTEDYLYNTYFTQYKFYERQSDAWYHFFRSLSFKERSQRSAIQRFLLQCPLSYRFLKVIE